MVGPGLEGLGAEVFATLSGTGPPVAELAGVMNWEPIGIPAFQSAAVEAAPGYIVTFWKGVGYYALAATAVELGAYIEERYDITWASFFRAIGSVFGVQNATEEAVEALLMTSAGLVGGILAAKGLPIIKQLHAHVTRLRQRRGVTYPRARPHVAYGAVYR